MYASFFGLKHEPFSITPDPRYLFMSERHREALAHLLYGVNGGGGFVLLSGEIGAGKTTVCRCFLEQIPRRCNVAYIFNPKLTVIELLKSVCEEFGLPAIAKGTEAPTVKDYVDPLNAFLLRSHGVGQNNVLVIDEAQMLSVEVLEQLRLLTNLETSERKLLQIILIGQPELRDMLARPELEQLAQRVIARYHLGALSPDETQQYILHRLAVAGMTAPMPFDARAVRRIHQLSRGVPRRINLLCDRALLGAYAQGRTQVDRAMVDQAAAEVFGHGERARRSGHAMDLRSLWSMAALVGAVLLAVLLLLSLLRHPASPGAGAPPSAASSPQRSTGASAASGASAGSTTAAPPTASPLAPASRTASAPDGASAASAATEPAAAPAVSTSAHGPSASVPAATFLTTASLQMRFPSLTRDEATAWRLLAQSWQIPTDGGDPCAAAQTQGVLCFRTSNGSLDLIRRLDRPGILTLRDSTDRPVYAVLTGLNAQTATLRIGDVSQTVSLVSLATLWRGEFATLWRTPGAYQGQSADGPTSALGAWFIGQLPGAGSAAAGVPLTEATWKAQVVAFQRAQGIKPDAVVGPTTLMQLSRVTGVSEPKLHSDSHSP